MQPIIKTEEEIELMRKGGKILGKILEDVVAQVRPGISTAELNEHAEEMIAQKKCVPAFKGYSIMGLPPFPGALCTSINEEVVHGLPVPGRKLHDGDIIGLDLGLKYTEHDTSVFLDAAITVGVGSIPSETMELIRVTRAALMAGVREVRHGARVGDVAHAIESYIAPYGYGIIRELVGHGVGRKIHELPEVPNYGSAGTGLRLELGMTIAIEPMVSLGDWQLIFSPRSWRIITRDHSISAHFEHTVLVTQNGFEILTLS